MYTDFAPFYDVVQGGVAEAFAGWIERRAGESNLEVGSVLELGCGTGAVLELLPSDWTKVGIDVSPEMLEIARTKGVDAELVEADIRSLSLSRTFDLVVCVYDTINHLPGSEWPAVFAGAAAHLVEGGAFLFDMNTLGRLRRDSGEPHSTEAEGTTVLMRIDDAGGDRFDWHVRIEREGTVVEDVISEHAVPLATVRAMLADAGFTRVEVSGGQGVPVDDDARRLFFVCRR